MNPLRELLDVNSETKSISRAESDAAVPTPQQIVEQRSFIPWAARKWLRVLSWPGLKQLPPHRRHATACRDAENSDALPIYEVTKLETENEQ